MGFFSAEPMSRLYNPSGNLMGYAVGYVNNFQRLFYIGEDQAIYNLWHDGVWECDRVCRGARICRSDSPLAFGVSNGNKQLFYIGADDLIYALVWNGSGWSNVCLDEEMYRCGAHSGLSFGIVNTGGFSVSRHVFYVAGDGRICFLKWSYDRWTNACANPDAVACRDGSPIVFRVIDDKSCIFYVGVDDRIHDLEWTGENWRNSCISLDTATCRIDSPLLFGECDGDFPVFYFNNDDKACELVCKDGDWTGRCLNEYMVRANPGSGLAYDYEFEVLYYQGKDGFINSLNYNATNEHWDNSILRTSIRPGNGTPLFFSQFQDCKGIAKGKFIIPSHRLFFLDHANRLHSLEVLVLENVK